MKNVFTTGEVAKLCNVAARTVSKWVDSGELAGYRIPLSNDRRITRNGLVRFLKDNHIPLGDLEMAQRPVLLISPDAMLAQRLFAELLLAPCNPQLLYARSAFEAGAVVTSLVPGLVVLDFFVGRSEALAMARHLSASIQAPWLIALVHEDEENVGEVEVAGFDDIHRRPIDVGLLSANLLSALAERAA